MGKNEKLSRPRRGPRENRGQWLVHLLRPLYFITIIVLLIIGYPSLVRMIVSRDSEDDWRDRFQMCSLYGIWGICCHAGCVVMCYHFGSWHERFAIWALPLHFLVVAAQNVGDPSPQTLLPRASVQGDDLPGMNVNVATLHVGPLHILGALLLCSSALTEPGEDDLLWDPGIWHRNCITKSPKLMADDYILDAYGTCMWEETDVSVLQLKM